ncbi:MAG: FeoB-associated Cys-rich membrane protein [Opitutaceae bacterium]|nr:FeoB-associated Cys-rich membrane protein [Opitutaceae bacterium]
MSATLQTVIALALVAVAAALLLRSWFGKKKSSGCGSASCSAISPEIKKLQARLKR